jgi:hypothetical protein
MIYLKRSVDFYKDVTWVANDLDEDRRRNRMLYAGKDVNGAIDAAVKAGMSREAAAIQAQNEINRCNHDSPQDEIAGVPWQ